MWRLCRYRGSCEVCKTWIEDAMAWLFWEGITSTHHVCQGCGDAAVSSQERV